MHWSRLCLYVCILLFLFAFCGDSYAVVGTVRGTVTDKGEAVPGVTIRITDPDTGKVVDEDTSDRDGAFYLWVPRDGSYKVEVIKDGRTVVTKDVSLTTGRKKLEIDIGKKSITPHRTPPYKDIRLSFSPGVKFQDGSTELDDFSALFGVNLTIPIVPVADWFMLNLALGYVASSTGLVEDDLTRIISGPKILDSKSTPSGPLFLKEWDVLRFDGTGWVHRARFGLSLERPVSWMEMLLYMSLMAEYTHYGFDKEIRAKRLWVSPAAPREPKDLDIRDATKDAWGFVWEIGALRELPWRPGGRPIHVGLGVGLEGTDTDFPRGKDKFYLEPYVTTHFAISPFDP